MPSGSQFDKWTGSNSGGFNVFYFCKSPLMPHLVWHRFWIPSGRQNRATIWPYTIRVILSDTPTYAPNKKFTLTIESSSRDYKEVVGLDDQTYVTSSFDLTRGIFALFYKYTYYNSLDVHYIEFFPILGIFKFPHLPVQSDLNCTHFVFVFKCYRSLCLF